MALVSTVVVWVLANVVGAIIRQLLGELPLAPGLVLSLASSLVSTAIVASLLTWVVMPRVTRVLARWLYVQAPSDTPRRPSE
jgi:antibiotic biosynthesis monooxygenase (ABM) superfamily enzyme